MSKEYTNNNLAENLRPRFWRSVATHNQYLHDRKADLRQPDACPLCEAETIQQFHEWRIIPNKYPYDNVAAQHDQLVPMRHTDGGDLTDSERTELAQLKQGVLNEQYDYLMEAFAKSKSIPGHFHLHLVVPKPVG